MNIIEIIEPQKRLGQALMVEEPMDTSMEPIDVMESSSTGETLVEVTEYETPREFLEYARTAMQRVPQFSRTSLLSIERAIGYLGKLASEIIKVCSADLDGTLTMEELNELESLYHTVDSQVDQLEGLKETLLPKKKKKRSELDPFWYVIATDMKNLKGIPDTETEVIRRFRLNDDEADSLRTALSEPEGLEKTATTTKFTYVPTPFIGAIARDIINGKVSSGHGIEELYTAACGRFELDEREKYELLHTLYDLGQPIHRPLLFEFGPTNYLA